MRYLDTTGLKYFWNKIKAKTSTLTLNVSGWSNNSQTLTVSGVTTSNLVIVSVNDNAYGIKCTEQSSNRLKFTCDTLPTVAVTVNIAIIN